MTVSLYLDPSNSKLFQSLRNAFLEPILDGSNSQQTEPTFEFSVSTFDDSPTILADRLSRFVHLTTDHVVLFLSELSESNYQCSQSPLNKSIT